MEKYILIFASVDTEDDLYQEIVGVYNSLEEAQKAMKDDIDYGVDGSGENIDEWYIKDHSATYKNNFSSVQKSYKIMMQNIN